MFSIMHGVMGEVLIHFKVWDKLAAQQLLVCTIEIHLEPIKQRVNAVSENVFIINWTFWLKERTVQCQIRSSLSQWCAI